MGFPGFAPGEASSPNRSNPLGATPRPTTGGHVFCTISTTAAPNRTPAMRCGLQAEIRSLKIAVDCLILQQTTFTNL